MKPEDCRAGVWVVIHDEHGSTRTGCIERTHYYPLSNQFILNVNVADLFSTSRKIIEIDAYKVSRLTSEEDIAKAASYIDDSILGDAPNFKVIAAMVETTKATLIAANLIAALAHIENLKYQMRCLEDPNTGIFGG